MNILLIHNYYQKRGGEDSVFENETNALKKQGHNVTVYSRHNDETKKFSFFQKLFFIFDSIYNKRTVNDLAKILDKDKIDIAHVHNVFPLISCSAYSFLKKRNIRTVQTIHNYRFLCPNGQFFRNNKICQLCKNGNFFYCIIFRCYKNSLLLSFLYTLIIKKFQRVFKNDISGYIALTGFTKKLFIEAGYDKKKIFIKDNAFINNKIKPKKPKDYFLYLGRISTEKGIDFLLEAFYKNDKYNLIVAGTGENIGNLKEKFRSKKITFKDFLHGKEKIKIFREAIALIVPSIWLENYPMSIVEAFSFHVPVIASDIGGLPYIVKDESNGLLFEPENFKSFNNKLDYIYNNKKQRDKMSKNAYKTFLSRMEFSKNILILEKIYKEVINAE